jgi:hypothetical protein
MRDADFPALYRSADQLSLKSQQRFLRALCVQLSLLVIAASLSVFYVKTNWAAIAQTVFLIVTTGCSIYLATQRLDRTWYASRAVAESVKTLTWRYVTRAEPFTSTTAEDTFKFSTKLRQILEQNRDVVQKLEDHLTDHQFTERMASLRESPFIERKNTYQVERIKNQLDWYGAKAKLNRIRGDRFFVALIASNFIALLLALSRIAYPSIDYWPTDIFIAISASLLTWIQAKRFSELAASYSLAAHEISLIRDQASTVDDEKSFSVFVADTENAFSREHTQWVARKDV